MIIKKINLENYRSHENKSVELSKGINLILGINGSGKTSILEAIGRVLFDIKDRTGNKKDGKEFIKYGENSAKIEIEFTAFDGRDYLVKANYNKKTSSIILKDLQTEEEYKNKNDIRENLNRLCGLKKDYTDIFENIIVAKQNEFINIFKEKAAEREKVFNKIFGTEIYSNMDKDFFLDIEKKYEFEKREKEVEQKTISENMKNEEEIFREIKNVSTEKAGLEKNLKSEENKKLKLDIEIRNFEENEREYRILEKEIFEFTKKIIKEKENLKRDLKIGKKAKFSKKLIIENEEGYNKYLELSKELEVFKEEFKILTSKEEKNILLKKENEKLAWEINQNKKNIEESKEKLNKFFQEKKDLEVLLKEIEKKYFQIEKDGKELRELFDELREIESLKNKLEEIEKEIKSLDKKNILFKLENIKKAKEELNEKNREISITKASISTLKEAQEKLSEKICPILKEECENVKDKNISDYFLKKINEEEQNQEKLKNNILKLEGEISGEYILLKNLAKYSNLEKELLKITNLLNLKTQTFDMTEYKTSKEIKGKADILKEEQDKLKLEEKRAELNSTIKNIDEYQNLITSLEKEIERKQEQHNRNFSEISEETSFELEKMKKRIENLESEQKEKQISYKIYLENLTDSNSLEEKLNLIQEEIKNIHFNREEKKNILILKTEIEEKLKDINIKNLKEESEEINLKILELTGSIGINSERLNFLNQDLEKLKSEKEKVKKLRYESDKIKEKLEKTKKIRNNLKSMGTQMSKYMLESISVKASVNFNKITARTEQILWTNEDSNKYAVFLVGENKNIAFEHLSGGEQVSVAIALRQAMTEKFSDSKFMILDEPTNNLDTERKKLLAEYMGELLNNLEQSIIVTHDDTFREMAERIIEL